MSSFRTKKMLHLVCAADKSERLYVDCARARGGVDGDCLSCTSGKTPPHPLWTARSQDIASPT